MHRHVVWLYGIVVALAIREALLAVAGPLLRGAQPSFDHVTWWPEMLQLATVITLSATFYFGSVAHFTQAHGAETENKQGDPSPAYKFDVASGLIHFVIVFFWATTLQVPDTAIVEDALQPVAFTVLIAFVLLYDWGWYITHRLAKGSAHKHILDWAIKNTVLLIILGAVIMFSTFVWPKSDLRISLGIALVPTLLLALWDFWNIVGGAIVGYGITRKR